MDIPAGPKLIKDVHSDYGSDFDTDGENLISDLVAELEARARKPLVLESIEDDTGTAPTSALLVPKNRCENTTIQVVEDDDLEVYLRRRALRSPSVEVEYNEHSRTSWRVARDDPNERPSVLVEPDSNPIVKDTRSPLQRFRTKPMKPLSVTDLVSPAWCELQYWYNLTKFGGKRATPAMRQGSSVHRALEEQVHEMVEVQVKTKEDMWGLKIWNIIQGLRTLRATGMTRELEIWGVIDGQVVNGIIDEISYICPDPEFEEEIELRKAEEDDRAKLKLPPNQTSMKRFLKGKAPAEPESGPWLGEVHPVRKVYITDVKTRRSKYPPQGASLRPTLMQLMLYRFLLDSLATNAVPADIIFLRYNLKPLEPFTSAFIADIGALDFNFREESPSSDSHMFNSTQASVHELESYNNLSAIWNLMISEFAQAIPGSSALSDVLQAEFRLSGTGEIIGSKIFSYDITELQKYLADEMSWWKGEREARGVDIEEAFKCRICEFSEECTWRKGKVEEASEKHKLRAAARAKSAV